MTSVDPAQWRAAADAIDAEYTGPGIDVEVRYAAAYLRRQADQAAQDQARPPNVNYVVEVYDDVAEEWVISNSRTTDLDKATATMRGHQGRWGRAARVVGVVETHTVIAEADGQACTCGAAGDCFVPAGHYADCPEAVR
ncbi:hypothetical protein ACWD2L_00330 [Streptomyces sp. NPDC002754]